MSASLMLIEVTVVTSRVPKKKLDDEKLDAHNFSTPSRKVVKKSMLREFGIFEAKFTLPALNGIRIRVHNVFFFGFSIF